jgi:hypothetical protein
MAKTRKSTAIKTPQRKQSRPARKRSVKASAAIPSKTRRLSTQVGYPRLVRRRGRPRRVASWSCCNGPRAPQSMI